MLEAGEAALDAAANILPTPASGGAAHPPPAVGGAAIEALLARVTALEISGGRGSGESGATGVGGEGEGGVAEKLEAMEKLMKGLDAKVAVQTKRSEQVRLTPRSMTATWNL